MSAAVGLAVQIFAASQVRCTEAALILLGTLLWSFCRSVSKAGRCKCEQEGCCVHLCTPRNKAYFFEVWRWSPDGAGCVYVTGTAAGQATAAAQQHSLALLQATSMRFLTRLLLPHDSCSWRTACWQHCSTCTAAGLCIATSRCVERVWLGLQQAEKDILRVSTACSVAEAVLRHLLLHRCGAAAQLLPAHGPRRQSGRAAGLHH